MTLAMDRYLEDIESRIDVDQEEEILSFWNDWSHHRAGSSALPVHLRGIPSKLDWPSININDALVDDELMVIKEFGRVNHTLSRKGAFCLRVRANYGVANIATAFGAPLFVMPRETDTLPNVVKLGPEACAALLDKPLPDKLSGNFQHVMRVGKLFKQIGERYPKIGKYVHCEQPDLQGPMDNLELLWGSELFYALYDEPETMHALLSRISDLIEVEIDEWLKLFPENVGRANYFRHREKGSLVVRDDSAMNLSPAFYDEFIAPYDGRLMKKYGGIVHFCGRGDHFIDHLAKLEGLNGINMSQPHLNNMEKVFACTIDQGLHLTLSVDPFEVHGHDIENLMFLPSGG